MGRSITLVGDSGAGQVCKVCNQLVIGGTLAARGLGDVLFVSELVGAILLFIGFRLATTQQPVPVTTTPGQKFIRVQAK